MTDPDLARLRPELLAVAYRMLGSVADAEDAVQDALLRYHRHAAAVASPEGWLVKAVTRRCVDARRRARRREYAGPWLPEPVPAGWPGAAADRAELAELAESLSLAFLVLLEALTPAERAAYLLRQAFGYEYAAIADLLATTPADARQLVSRAGKRVGGRERRFAPPAGAADALSERFFAACRAGDVAAVEALLAADAALYSDGGGKAFAAPRPVTGAAKVARLLAVVFRKAGAAGPLTDAAVNGRPGVVMAAAGRPHTVVAVAHAGDRVVAVYVVRNPDKLTRWH